MTEAEEIAELRRWLRADIGALHQRLDQKDVALHSKLDAYKHENDATHDELKQAIAEIKLETQVKGAVVATKIGLFVTFLSITVAAVASSAFQKVFG